MSVDSLKLNWSDPRPYPIHNWWTSKRQTDTASSRFRFWTLCLWLARCTSEVRSIRKKKKRLKFNQRPSCTGAVVQGTRTQAGRQASITPHACMHADTSARASKCLAFCAGTGALVLYVPIRITAWHLDARTKSRPAGYRLNFFCILALKQK
jgi:hypothetical protein